jgi:Tfp pilus assembly protein PilN
MTTPDLNQGTTGVVAPTTLPSVNLMPAEIAEAARFRRMQFAMGAAVIGAVVVVGALYVHNHSSVSAAQSQLDSAKAQYATAQTELAGLSNVQNVYNQVAAKQAMVQQAMGQEVDWSTYLSDLSLRIPDNVWLSNLSATESDTGLGGVAAAPVTGGLTPTGIGQITFSGVAFSHDDVATWLDVLAKEKGFTNAYFSNSTKGAVGPKPVVNFSSSVVLTDDAKSGRFTKPAGS